MIDRIANQTRDTLLLIGRILMAVVFLPAGFMKLLGLGAFAVSLESRGVPAPYLMAAIGGASEFFGGLAVLLGFQTRMAAILLLVFTVIATGISHRYWEFTDPAIARMQQSSFFKNVGIIAGFMFLFVAGGGRFSLDALLGRSKQRPQ